MTITTETRGTMQPSTTRPVTFRCRDDLVVSAIRVGQSLSTIIKDPVSLRYVRLSPEQAATLRNLNGERSLQEVREILQAGFPATHITLGDVQTLVLELQEQGLLVNQRLNQGEKLLARQRETRWKQFWQTVGNPLFVRLPGWDPDHWLTRIDRWCGWIFSVPALIISGLLVAISSLFVLLHVHEIQQRLPEFEQFFGWPNLLLLWVALAATKVLHEFGHGVACKHFGGECHAMGVALMVLSPTLYCDVTDSWTLNNKWQRIMIAAAGMYVETLLAAIAILVWYFTQPGVLHYLALNVFFISTVTTVIFNANPLLRYDGYYMLSDYLEIPNLQSRGSRVFTQSLTQWLFDAEPPHDPFQPATGRGWFLTYAIASTVYRWMVLCGVLLFLYTVLKPYRLQSLGVLAAVGSLSGIVGHMLRSLVKLLQTPRQTPLSRLRVGALFALLAVGGTGSLLIPIPWYQSAACYVEPVGVQHVYNPVPGLLDQLDVIPGAAVQREQPLLSLSSPELSDRAAELEVEIAAQNVELQLCRETGDPESLEVARQRLHSLQEQSGEIARQRERLKIIAPVAGRVIEAPAVPAALTVTSDRRLPRWSGTVLEPQHRGAELPAGTHLCSIAPERGFQAILLIEQAGLVDLRAGERVRVKFDAFPGRVFSGTVQEFARQQRETVPLTMSRKTGGPFPTVTDPAGAETLVEPVYEATVTLDPTADVLKSGLRGSARCIVSRRTLFEWIARACWTTFNFRL